MKPLAACAVLVAVGLAVWVQPASSHYPPAPERRCGTDAVLVKKAWEAIKAPPGLAQITTQAAGGPDGKILLASDGHKVMRSEDGGCTWGAQPVYAVPTGDVDSGGALPIVSAAVFPDGDATRSFLLVDGIGRAAAAQLLASDDGGKTWQPSGAGLPQTGGFRDLVGSGGRPYLVSAYNDTAGDNDPAGVSGALYASTDGGRTWDQRSQGVQIERLAVAPGAPDQLWAVRADHTVQRSDDGGRTWAPVTMAADPDDGRLPTAANVSNWRDLAVARRSGGPVTVVVVAADSRTSNVSRIVASQDGGRSFKDLPIGSLGPVTGVTFGNSPSQILIVSGSDSTAFHGPGLRAFDLDYGRWRDVDDMALESLRETRPVALSAASRGHAGLRALQFRRDAPGETDPPQPDLIARYTPPDPPAEDPSLFDRVRCRPDRVSQTGGAAPRPKSVTFDPDELSVQLQPGKTTRVDLKAALTAVPTPLDAYFLIDGSNSSDAARDGVRCSVERLAAELVDHGVDARFGVATFSDRYSRRYQRLLDLSPFGPALAETLFNLLPQEGNGTPFRSALYQTATGAGLDVDDDQGGQPVPVHIDPGQQANYRPGALHVAMVVADEPYEDGVAGEPTREQVVEALKARQILSIGIQITRPAAETVQDPDHSPANQLLLNQQLRYFAQGTGAVAPTGGVDCDGGGQPDLQQGDPLVCQVDNQGIRETMGDTLLTLLTQFRETADVRLVPQDTSGLSVSVEGGDAKNVDIRKPSELAATAVMSCTAEQAGRHFELSFAVLVGDRTVGTLPAEATCGRKVAPVVASRRPRREPPPSPAPGPAPAKSPAPAVHQPAPPATAPAPPHPAAVPAPAPQPPSPAPVTPTPAASPSAAATPSSMPAASSAPSPAPAAVAAAPQREGRPQVAHVAGEHAMSAWRPTRAHAHETVPAPALITLGLGVCGAFGWFGWAAASPRRRPRLAVERVAMRR